MSASRVIGQTGFFSSTCARTQNGMCFPNGTAYDAVHERLFVGDYGYSRVMVYDVSGGVTDTMPASYALGVTSFTASGGALTQTGIGSTADVAYDPNNDLLYVADDSYNRVLVYDVRPAGSSNRTLCGTTTTGIATGMNASCVLGQSNFTSATFFNPPTQSSFAGPSGISYDAENDRLFVGDTYNARVLMFNVSGGLSNNMLASNVIGQTDYITKTTGRSQTKMQFVFDTTYDPDLDVIFVSDSYDRILAFDVRPQPGGPGTGSSQSLCGASATGIQNGMNASCVLGVSTFTGTGGGGTAAQNLIRGTLYTDYDAVHKRLYAGDFGWNRVTVYDVRATGSANSTLCGTTTTGIANGMNASCVLGQPDFVSSGSGTSRSQQNQSYGVAFDAADDRLFVADASNNRVITYDFSAAILPKVAGGENFSLALKSDGTVWAWGLNGTGQLGNAGNTDSPTPVQVTGLSNAVAIAAGEQHSVALKEDGTVWTWGRNNFGQLGNATSGGGTDSNVPVQVHGVGDVGFLTGVIAVAADGFHSLALKGDGTVWAWGWNGSGQLGDATTSNSSTPVQTGISNVIAIGAGRVHSLAVTSDGGVWAWGSNFNGELGNNTTSFSATSSPVQVLDSGLSPVTGMVEVAGGSDLSFARKSDGTMWAWGLNGEGQLGINSHADSHVAVQVHGEGDVGSLANVTAIASGYAHGMALKSDGTVRAWGTAFEGEIGDGANTERDVPTPVTNTGLASSVIAIDGGWYHSMAVKSVETFWDWGYNFYGQLGIGTSGSGTDSNVPVQASFAGPGPQNPTLSNKIVMSRLKAGAASTVSIQFTLQDTLSGTLTVTFPAGFTVTAAATGPASSACLSAFGFTSTTLTATKTNCSGTITLGGATVTNPVTPGVYNITWVNDDPGSTLVAIVDDDQVSVTGSVASAMTFNVGSQASATACDGTFSANGGTLGLGSLTTGAVASSDISSVPHICTRVTTNAGGGAVVTVRSQNASLKSVSAPADAIASSTATLVAGTTGYGLCAGSGGGDSGKDTTTPAGATPAAASPFNGSCSTSAHVVGGLTTTPQTVWSFSGPSQNAFFRLFLKAAISPSVPAHSDYADTLTFIATGTY